MESNQCVGLYPLPLALNGIALAGIADSPRTTLESRDLSDSFEIDKATSVGKKTGYKSVAGSKEAGTSMRCRTERNDSFPLFQLYKRSRTG